MKDKKREFLPYSFYDYDAHTRHFAKMSERGWLVEGTSFATWVYRRVEPKKRSFAVSYFAKASSFDPEPGEEQREFIDFCERTGWKLAATYAQMQVFYNENDNPIPIETDPALEVESIHKAAKRAYLPFFFLLLVLAILNLVTALSMNVIGKFPLTFLTNGTHLFGMAANLLLLLMSVVELTAYYLWLRRARRAAREAGTLIPSAGHRKFQIAILVVTLLLLAALPVSLLLYEGRLAAFIVLFMLVLMAAMYLITWLVRKGMARRKMPSTVTMLATLGTATVLSVAVVATVLLTAIGSMDGALREDADSLPLRFEDLYDGDNYKENIRRDGSPLLTCLTVLQFESPGDSLNYTFYEVKLPFLVDPLRNLTLRDLEKDGTVDGEHYLKADPAPWHADRAFRLNWQGVPLDHWLLFYGDRIVFLNLGAEPTKAQMDTVALKLGGV